jgi:hypothetical protein
VLNQITLASPHLQIERPREGGIALARELLDGDGRDARILSGRMAHRFRSCE